MADGAPADAEQFLRELRRLRDLAGLGLPELAARAHYPYDVLQAAETGPGLPDLPVLSAYVRGCGGTIAEWEERWRSLTRSPASPLLPTRAAGCSDAATAGARIGTTTGAADDYASARIMAALDRVADGMAGPIADTAAAAQPSPAVPGMRLPAAPSATAPGGTASERPDGATSAPAPQQRADSRPAAAGARPPAVSSLSAARALATRKPAGAARARGAVGQRAVIAALVAVVIFLVGVVLVFAR
jgi:hypothetical protein